MKFRIWVEELLSPFYFSRGGTVFLKLQALRNRLEAPCSVAEKTHAGWGTFSHSENIAFFTSSIPTGGAIKFLSFSFANNNRIQPQWTKLNSCVYYIWKWKKFFICLLNGIKLCETLKNQLLLKYLSRMLLISINKRSVSLS